MNNAASWNQRIGLTKKTRGEVHRRRTDEEELHGRLVGNEGGRGAEGARKCGRKVAIDRVESVDGGEVLVGSKGKQSAWITRSQGD